MASSLLDDIVHLAILWASRWLILNMDAFNLSCWPAPDFKAFRLRRFTSRLSLAMNQGPWGDCLMKKNEGRKSDDTVYLSIKNGLSSPCSPASIML
jgi:hypothetical protein